MMKACRYYYRDQLTMAEIGERLGISRHRVGRLLKEAVDSGVVRIEIQPPPGESAETESRLERELGLKAAVVVDVPPELPAEDLKRATCRAGAEFLRELLHETHTIGVGWGSTTFELINQLEPLELPGVTVVQITGGNKALPMHFDCHEVTRRLAQKLHVQPVLLHAPGIVDNRQTRELLMRESAIVDTVRHFEAIDIAIIGIGAIVPEIQSMFVSSGYVSAKEVNSLRRAGAVGDVFSYFIDDHGDVVRTELYDRLITIGQQHIRQIPRTVGVATGAAKARAVAAAIRGGFVNTLIADGSLARALLAERSSAHRPVPAPREEKETRARMRTGVSPGG